MTLQRLDPIPPWLDSLAGKMFYTCQDVLTAILTGFRLQRNFH